MKIRKDVDKEAEVMFCERTGLKIRRTSQESYSKSTFPELVDVKLTNYCTYGCSFCYQSSIKTGSHGSLAYIIDVIDVLSEMGVFEIAFGGGETTEHPFFAVILEYSAKKKIVPNFTCFGTKWLQNPEILKSVRNNVGGIGVSVHSAKTVEKYIKIKNAMKGFRPKVLMQHVFGTIPFDEMKELISKCEDVLLLGYKTVGFGSSFQPFQYSDAEVKELLQSVSGRLSVDTAFIDKHGSILRDMKISEKLMSSPEGKFSCYIDAVKEEIGASSYVDPKEMIKLQNESLIAMFDEVKSSYAQF